MATDTGFGKVKIFDDFLGDLLADEWDVTTDSGGSGSSVIITAAVNGVLNLTTDDQTDGDEVALTLGLNWQASDGGMIMEARVKCVTAITLRGVFVGFTDVLGSTTLEMPCTMSGTTLTANAGDCVGFMYDTDADTTSEFWHCASSKTVKTTPVNTSVAPVADTWQTLRVVVNADGDATFWINGKYEGKIDDAITASTDCTPIVAIEVHGTNANKILYVDYVYVEGGRN